MVCFMGGDLAPSLGDGRKFCLGSDSIFSVFVCLYRYITYMTLFLTKNLLLKPVLVSSYFASHPITVLLKILEGRMHGPSPLIKFGGTVPQSPHVVCNC